VGGKSVEKCGVGCEEICGKFVEKCGGSGDSDFYTHAESTRGKNVESEGKSCFFDCVVRSYPHFTQGFPQLRVDWGEFSTGLESGGKSC
jgi:hypothetical protein